MLLELLQKGYGKAMNLNCAEKFFMEQTGLITCSCAAGA